MNELIWKHCLKNALDYGKASESAVLGKVLAECPDLKKDFKKTLEEIKEAIGKVNELSRKEIEEEVKKYSFNEVKKTGESPSFFLENAVKGRVVTRFAPEPNGFPHIGHAKAAFLSCEAAKAYSGKFILRWDDTNPETEKKEFVEGIKEGLSWLGLSFDKEFFASDYMNEFYSFAEKLVIQENAYVCRCSKEEITEGRKKGIECVCRKNSVNQNLDLWNEMLSRKLKKGEAVLRLKADMKSYNTVMRDPTLFRIVSTEHWRQGKKYVVWPTYDFEVSIADYLTGVTHALRSKEYELRDELYYKIFDLLKLPRTIIYDFSRLNIKGTTLSKRFLKPLIMEKKVSGWDDPRLPTLAGLKRRGILPQAIKSFVLSFGLSKVESEPSWEALLSENRKLLDDVSERYFFVKNPVLLRVDNAPEEKAILLKHPSKQMGFRELYSKELFFIQESDAKQLQVGSVFRLKDLYNVKIKEKGKELVGEYAGKELIEGTKKIHWLPKDDKQIVSAKLLVPGDLIKEGEFNEESLSIEKGFCEKACKNLKEGTIIQFERIGFARLDSIKEMNFILSC